MTIKSEWVKIWKTACPKCFTTEPRFKPTVYFIDGQIKLMKSHHVRTWEQFIEFQFCNVIRRAFRAGCNVVVLAFDNYALVPSAKGMTQAKRNKATVEFEFNMHESLPATIPECWDSAIRNRVFKSKVIDYVKTYVPKLIQLTNDQRLVIDHKDHPVMYYPNQLCKVLENIEPKGECDVKFTSYTSMGSMLIDAIDGDYIPMAMLHLENEMIENQREPNSITIYRMICNNGGSETKGTKLIEQCFKRKAPDSEEEEEDDKADQYNPLKAKRKYEYVYVNDLYKQLSTIVRQTYLDVKRPGLVLATLAAMTGCDYTQGLPTIGPTRVWKMRKIAIPYLDTDNEKMIMKAFVKLYMEFYEAHINRCPQRVTVQNSSSAEPVFDPFLTLKNSTQLAESTKKLLPSMQYILSHAKNVNWTLKYWEARGSYPDPIGTQYGYKKNSRTGAPEYCVTLKDAD